MGKISKFEYLALTVDATGHPQEQHSKTAQCLIEELTAELLLELVTIPGGSFIMGAPRNEEGWHPTQAPQHEVTIAPFWIGKYPITQAQWEVVAAFPKINRPLAPKPACFIGESRPVEQVSWLDAVEFCDRLSAHTGNPYRLPTESEWEYACRAIPTLIHGKPGVAEVLNAQHLVPFCFGETITTDLANYSGVDWEFDGRICSKGAYGKGPAGGDRRETTEVGSFQVANAFGLFDMHGNVREWCQDCWHNSYENAPTNGSAWITDGDCQQRVLRGGSWNSSPKACRSAARGRMDVDAGLYDIGFRVVCSEFVF